MINNISFPALGLDFTINRAAFSVFGADIYTYGLLIGAGIILGFVYAVREADRVGLKQDDLLNMFLIAVPTAIVCARIYYVVFSLSEYMAHPAEMFNIRNGGLAIYGGIIGSAAVIFTYCRIKKIGMGKVFDILAIGLLIGQAVGRWGNFVNGEAFGRETALPWAMKIVTDGVLVTSGAHPTFLYESLWNLCGIAVLSAYKKRTVFQGELFCGYLTWYGVGRMMIEGLRTDSLYLGVFRVSQLLSALLAAVGVAVIVFGRRNVSAANSGDDFRTIEE